MADKSTYDLNMFIGILICVGCSLFSSIYIELFLETTLKMGALFSGEGFLKGDPSSLNLLIVGGLFGAFLILFISLSLCKRDLFAYMFKYRWLIGLTALLILVLLNINFSSISLWQERLNGTLAGSGLLFGRPRSVRSDEIYVSTLFNISQGFNNNNCFSDLVRGTFTDTRLVFNLPSWSLITLFRPQLWGYLFFGSERGLSFFWCSKWIFLLLLSIELAYRLTKSQHLSLFFSLVITFSPCVEWWGGCEILIFGEGLVVVFYDLLQTERTARCVIDSLIITWLADCYLLTLYPAWMVPFFYVFAAFAVFIVINESYSLRHVLKRVAFVGVALLISILLVVIVLFESAEALKLTTGTVYPGHRESCGGGDIRNLTDFGSSLFFAIEDSSILNNSEMSRIVSFFPIGTILSLLLVFLTKKHELIPLILIQLLFIIYCTVGLPSVIARLTLMSNSFTERVLYPFGYLELALLTASINKLKLVMTGHNLDFDAMNQIGRISSPMIAIGCVFVLFSTFFGVVETTPIVLRILFKILLFCGLGVLFMALGLHCSPSFGSSIFSRVMVISAFSVVMISGMCVNPIQIGAAPVLDTPLANSIQKVSNSNPGKLLAVDDWTLSNYCVANGATTVFSTNMYPDLNLLHCLDRDGRYSSVYNRYFHAVVDLTCEKTSFELIQEDLIRIHLNYDDLKIIGVKYLITADLRHISKIENLKFTVLNNVNGYYLLELI